MRTFFGVSGFLLISTTYCCGTLSGNDADNDGISSWADCDDHDARVFPGATERCNDADDDCDWSVDEDASDAERFYSDDDGDGHSDPEAYWDGCHPPDNAGNPVDDCDDNNASTYPGAEEWCDGEDNDCDGEADEDVTTAPTVYADLDGDGWGDAATMSIACEVGEGFSDVAGDCDDTEATVHPRALERCGNGLDDDCLAETTDACSTAYLDLDAAAEAVLLGDAEDAFAGAFLAGVGDIDRDGLDDLAVGAAADSAGLGTVYLALGPVSGTASLSIADWALQVDGIASFGAAVAADGDLDNDGYGGVLVGSPRDGAGVAWLFDGPDFDCDPYCDGLRIDGAADGDMAGAALSAAGDTDGDGLREVAVGAPEFGSGGAVYLVERSADAQVSLADAVQLPGSPTGARAGGAIAAGGDLNGDGYDDLAEAGTGGGVAPARLFAGPITSASVETATVTGTDRGDARFASVTLGDLDGDGFDDLALSIVRSTESPDPIVGVFFGPVEGVSSLAEADLTLAGGLDAPGGARISSGGDVNLDGADELLLAAPAATTWISGVGDAYIPGSVWVFRGPHTQDSFAFTAANARLGVDSYALELPVAVFAGDTDGDGRDDLAVGGPRDGTVAVNAGAVWLVSGAALGL